MGRVVVSFRVIAILDKEQFELEEIFTMFMKYNKAFQTLREGQKKF